MLSVDSTITCTNFVAPSTLRQRSGIWILRQYLNQRYIVHDQKHDLDALDDTQSQSEDLKTAGYDDWLDDGQEDFDQDEFALCKAEVLDG